MVQAANEQIADLEIKMSEAQALADELLADGNLEDANELHDYVQTIQNNLLIMREMQSAYD